MQLFKKVFFSIMILLLVSFSQKKVTIFMAGDSTMSIKPPEKRPETGWGMPFAEMFKKGIKIENKAANGRSTRTFISEGKWQSIIDNVTEGDYVMIQFGHNDQSKEKIDRYTSLEDYKINLEKFIAETRAKKATPILLTPVVRRRFDKEGKFYDAHGEYPNVVRLVAKESNVLLIDMQQKYHIIHSVISIALHHFALWMQDNWGYLIHDNTEFWLPYLRTSCEAIRTKLLDHYDVEVDEIVDDGHGFLIAQFIDCIIIPSSRTGGGPMTPGKFAARFPYLVQEALYSGWAKVHGIKKQAMGLANGMAFNISKGYSCRRHDMHLLADTDMNSVLEADTMFMCYCHKVSIT